MSAIISLHDICKSYYLGRQELPVLERRQRNRP